MKRYRVLLIVCLLILTVGTACIHKNQRKSNRISDIQDEAVYVSIICDAVKAMDFSIRKPQLKITPQEDRLYKEGYLKILKNQIPISEGQEYSGYYKNLWQAGMEFQDLVENKSINKFPYLLYYDDLDGDGKPELGINQGGMYIFNYELGENEFTVLYGQESCYFGKILGAGQIWYHDGLHANVIRDRYVVLNRDNKWEEYALDLEQGTSPSYHYYLVGTSLYKQIDVGEENWNEITKSFFEATKQGIPQKTFEEIFGDLLDDKGAYY